MTRAEAIEYNKNLREYMRITDKESEYKFLKENYEALDLAIKALEQEPVIDKIRAEIEQLRLHKAQFITSDNKVCIDSQEVLNIIDKYKAESEVRE